MLSEVLVSLIQASGKSQRQIANDLNLGVQRFNYYVTGKREPDTNTLQSIADYFHVSVDYLLGREEAKKEPITTSDDGLDEELRNFIEKLKGLDEETLLAIEKLVDSIISQRGQ